MKPNALSYLDFLQDLALIPKLLISLVVILIAAVILIVLWTPKVKTASEGATNDTNTEAARRSDSIVWDDHLGHSYVGSGASLRTESFQIGAKNNLGHELRLERVYAVSGEGAGEKDVEIAADGAWVAADRIMPIGNQQSIVLRIPFGSMLAKDVFDNWKNFQITLVHSGGKVSRKDVTEELVRNVYQGFKPSPIGPQVRIK